MRILNILNFKKNKEHEDVLVFAEEDNYFKKCNKKYYIRKINNSIELWASSLTDSGENYYIGIVDGDKVILSKHFRTYPYDVQKGGSKLCRIYLYNDWRDL